MILSARCREFAERPPTVRYCTGRLSFCPCQKFQNYYSVLSPCTNWQCAERLFVGLWVIFIDLLRHQGTFSCFMTSFLPLMSHFGHLWVRNSQNNVSITYKIFKNFSKKFKKFVKFSKKRSPNPAFSLGTNILNSWWNCLV